jgi:hypothetical protein
MNRWTSALMTLGMGLVLGLTASAQPQPGQGNQPGQPGGNNRGNRGNFDPAAMRQRYLDSIKQDLGASDDEWKALEPRVQKVLDAERLTRSRGGRTRGGQTDPNAQPRPEDNSAVSKAAAELKAAIDDKSTPPAVLAQKLSALRAARDQAKADTAAAQKELKELLTQRQEAIMVNRGLLE